MFLKKFRSIDGYLNLAALLPFNEELPRPEQAPAALIQEVATRWIEATVNKPELGLPISSKSQGDAEDRYELFWAVRHILRTLVDVVTDPEVKKPSGYNTVMDPRMFDLEIKSSEMSRSIALTGNGILRAEDGLGIFLNCLQQLGPEVWSLRRCPVCDAPFLPRREDQQACTPRCNDVLRTRRFRASKARKTRMKRRA